MNLDGLGRARVDLSWVERALTGLRNPDLRPAWKAAKKPLRADQRDHAKRREGPGGAWPARSPLTQARRSTGSGKRKRARKLLGKLPSALTAKHTRTSVSVMSRSKWSAVHQEGGTAGNGARIPARPFLWASDKLLETVAGILSKGLKVAFAKVK